MIDTQEVELTSVDDRDCHKNTRSTSDCTREVSGDGEEAKDSTAESSRSGNDPLEFLTEAVSFWRSSSRRITIRAATIS